MSFESAILADALFRVIEANYSLETAKKQVPSYTGDLEPEDYYREELEEYRLASEDFKNVIVSVNHDF